MKVLVIIPTYNESENVLPLVERVFETGKKSFIELLDILVVDDNSPDGTGELVKKKQSDSSNLHLLTGQKAGLGKAYVRGLKFGLDSKKSYDTFVLMDADFSHDPKYIPALLRAIDKGNDYVIGSRYVRGGGTAGNWPFRRLLQSRLANLLAKLLIGGDTGVADLTGGFKAVRRSALEQIPFSNIRARGYVFQVNFLYEFTKRNFKVTEVPIIFANRRQGKSKIRLRDMTEFAVLAFRLNPDSTLRRIIRFGLVGAVGAVVNIGVLVSCVHFLGISAWAGAAVGLETSILTNFIMNHLFTFRFFRAKSQLKDSTASLLEKLVRYNFIALGGAIITYGLFAAGYRLLGLHYVLADLLAILAATGWNYWMSIRLVWRVIDQ